jgi:energy-coupling factor transporter ATP-binding protein EcfA2
MATRRLKVVVPGDPGRVARIQIKGFKAIADQTIDLGRLNVFIGENGAGKSTVLEAIGLLGAAAAGRVDAGELMRRGVRASATHLLTTALGGRPPAKSIHLAAESDSGVRYAVTLAPPSKVGWPPLWRFTSESVYSGATPVYQRRIRAVNVKATQGRARPEPALDPGLGAGARAIALSDSRTRDLFFSLSDAVIFDPKTPMLRGIAPDPFHREPLGLEGGGLALALKALLTPEGGLGPMDPDELFALIHWASSVTVGPPDLEIAPPSVPMMNEVIRFVDRRMLPGRNVVSAFDASEGALYVLFALTLLFHPHGPRLFGVEGLDHALHPRLARALVRTMGEHVSSEQKQILLTTHNPLVLDGLDLGNKDVRLFTVERADSGATVVHRVEHTEALQKAQASGATLSQMWLQGLLGAVPDVW